MRIQWKTEDGGTLAAELSEHAALRLVPIRHPDLKGKAMYVGRLTVDGNDALQLDITADDAEAVKQIAVAQVNSYVSEVAARYAAVASLTASDTDAAMNDAIKNLYRDGIIRSGGLQTHDSPRRTVVLSLKSGEKDGIVRMSGANAGQAYAMLSEWEKAHREK